MAEKSSVGTFDLPVCVAGENAWQTLQITEGLDRSDQALFFDQARACSFRWCTREIPGGDCQSELRCLIPVDWLGPQLLGWSWVV